MDVAWSFCGMSSRRWQNLAKYFYDMSKLIMASSVVAQLVAYQKLELKVVAWGLIGGILCLIEAVRLDKKGDE